MSIHQETHETILKEDFKRITFLFKCVWCHLKKQKHSIFTCDDWKKGDVMKRKIWKGSKLELPSWRPFERLCKNLSILAQYFLPKIQRYKIASILQHGMYQCLEQSLTYLLSIHSNRTLFITYWPINVQNWDKYLPHFTSFTHVVHHSPLIWLIVWFQLSSL